MTWAGEAGADGSGLYIFTDDGSPQLIGGSEDQVLVFRDGVPRFDPQSTLDEVPGASGNFDLEHVIWVAKEGGDYTTIKEAVESIPYPTSQTNKWNIRVAPGLYVEQPFVLYSGVSIYGMGGTTVYAANSGVPLITATGVGLNSTIRNVTFYGPTNSTALVLDNSQSVIELVAFTYYKNAIRIDGDLGINLIVSAYGLPFNDNVGTFCEQNGGRTILSTVLGINGYSLFQVNGGDLLCNNSTCFGVKIPIEFNGGDADVNVMNIQAAETGIFLHQGSGLFNGTAINISKEYPSVKHVCVCSGFYGQSRILNSVLEGDKILAYDFSDLAFSFFDEKVGDVSNRFYSELTVGSPEYGRESVFGQGDSYTRGMFVYTSGAGGGTLTDVSDEAAGVNESSFTFPGTAVDNSFYVASDLYDANSDRLQWHGIKTKLDAVANLGTGSIVTEIWNGSTWEEIGTMSTRAVDDYASSGILKFTMESEQIRFNARAVKNSWVKNDILGDGIDRYWARFRIDSAITTSPTIEQIKLHSSRTEINSDGYVEHFGTARNVKSIAWDIGNAKPASDSPLNQDVYFGDYLDVGHTENKFSNKATDRIALAVYLPADIDTSTPLKLQWSWITDDNTNGNTRWVIRWAVSNDGSNIYYASADSPTSAPGQKSSTEIVAQVNQYTQQTHTVYLDISDYNTTSDSMLWISIERNGVDAADTHGGDVVMLQVIPKYLSWNNGAHIFGEY